jgi:hypothetical protein
VAAYRFTSSSYNDSGINALSLLLVQLGAGLKGSFTDGAFYPALLGNYLHSNHNVNGDDKKLRSRSVLGL